MLSIMTLISFGLTLMFFNIGSSSIQIDESIFPENSINLQEEFGYGYKLSMRHNGFHEYCGSCHLPGSECDQFNEQCWPWP